MVLTLTEPTASHHEKTLLHRNPIPLIKTPLQLTSSHYSPTPVSAKPERSVYNTFQGSKSLRDSGGTAHAASGWKAWYCQEFVNKVLFLIKCPPITLPMTWHMISCQLTADLVTNPRHCHRAERFRFIITSRDIPPKASFHLTRIHHLQLTIASKCLNNKTATVPPQRTRLSANPRLDHPSHGCKINLDSFLSAIALTSILVNHIPSSQ